MRLIGNLVECHNILLVLALQDHWRTTLQWRSWRCGIGWSRRGRRWSSSSRSSTSFTASLNSSKWSQVGLNKSAGLNFFFCRHQGLSHQSNICAFENISKEDFGHIWK